MSKIIRGGFHTHEVGAALDIMHISSDRLNSARGGGIVQGWDGFEPSGAHDLHMMKGVRSDSARWIFVLVSCGDLLFAEKQRLIPTICLSPLRYHHLSSK